MCFTPDFKFEAVEMVKAPDGNIDQVARESGIYDSPLGNWVRQARAGASGAPLPRSGRRSATWNDNRTPFVWHKTTEQILERLAGYCTALSQTPSK